MKKKIKEFEDSTYACQKGITTQMNEWLEQNQDVNILDIKYISNNDKIHAFILYEVE